MRRSITMLMAALIAVGMLASFAGPVAADHDEVENDIEVNNEINNQQQTSVQASNQVGVAVSGYGDATVEQTNVQVSEQDQSAANVNEVNALQGAAAV